MKQSNEQAAIRERNISEERAKTVSYKEKNACGYAELQIAWCSRNMKETVVSRKGRVSRAWINEDIVYIIKEFGLYPIGQYCPQLWYLQVTERILLQLGKLCYRYIF